MRPQQSQPAAFLFKPLEVAHKFTKTGRINIVDAGHVDQHGRRSGIQQPLEKRRKLACGLTEIDDSSHRDHGHAIAFRTVDFHSISLRHPERSCVDLRWRAAAALPPRRSPTSGSLL